MRLKNDGHVTDLKGNVVRVDFRREPDPPGGEISECKRIAPIERGRARTGVHGSADWISNPHFDWLA